MREARLRWLEQVERKTDKDGVKRTWEMEASGHRKIERSKLRWRDVTQKDTKERAVQREEAQHQRIWRMKTRPQRPKKKCVSLTIKTNPSSF